MQALFTKSQWLSSPTAYWTIQYEYKRNGADMQYRFYWKVWLGSSGAWYYNGLQLQLFLNGEQKNITVKGYNDDQKGWSYDGTTSWYTVSNKTSGTVPFYAKLYDTSAKSNRATSSSYKLTVSGASSVLGNISNFNVDNGVDISITKYNSSFVDDLVISYGGTTVKTVSGITSGTKVVFTSEELTAIYKLMTSVNSGQFTFALTTKNGSTVLGTSTKTATGSITNANPIFTSSQISYADTNETVTDITNNPLHIVQNQSNLSVTFTDATANKEATISKYDITVNGTTKTATKSGIVDFGKINTSADVEISITVTDSRGNTATAKKTVTILEWSLPVFTASLERLNNYEDETYLTVDASISSVNGKNTLRIWYEYAERNGIYSRQIEIADKTKTTLTLDRNKAYDFNIVVEDAFDYSSNQYVVDKGKFPLFIDTRKNAVGINDFPAEGEALRVADGVARFVDGIVLNGGSKSFLITITDSGTLNITEYK